MPQPRAKTRIRLKDLTDEDKRVLLEEARELAKRNPTDVDGYEDLSDREKSIRALMDARDHLRECPVGTGQDVGRVEGYDSTIPPRPDLGMPARDIAVIRCAECGGATVLDHPLERALEEHELELAQADAVEEGGEVATL
jgi:hypothetical protein